MGDTMRPATAVVGTPMASLSYLAVLAGRKVT